MKNEPRIESTVKVEATVCKDPRKLDPMAQQIELNFRLSGIESISFDKPGYCMNGDDMRAVVTGKPTSLEQGAIAQQAFEFGDRLFTKVHEAVHVALFGTVAYKAKHPTQALRDEIAGLRKELEDMADRLRTAETQRDELRRLFDPPIIINNNPNAPMRFEPSPLG